MSVTAESIASTDSRPYRTWLCVVCGFTYDEAEGLPEEGIEPGTRWEDIPDTWTCPDCGVGKEDFEMIEVS
ncbi:MAG: rubredoxin [Lysobacteraceae bacterium]